jgi:hypothetical protein
MRRHQPSSTMTPAKRELIDKSPATAEPTPDSVSDSQRIPNSDLAGSDVSSAAAESRSDLTEDLALAALKNRELPAADLDRIAKNSALMKSRKVRLAMAAHPRAPRRIALRLLREFATFDLMQFSLMPAPAADLKRAAGELLITRLASITLGERIALARRSAPNVAAALLLDKESRVWQTALENPRVTEAAVVKALRSLHVTPRFVEAICRHAKWSLRPEIRNALLANPHTPLARALEFARRLRPAQLRDLLHTSRLPEKIKSYLRKDAQSRR